MIATKLNTPQKLLNAIDSLQLQNGKLKKIIEYGNGKHNNRSTGVRIQMISTPAGFQYAVHQINSIGQQGSGRYSICSTDTLLYAHELKTEYTKPIPNKFLNDLISLQRKEKLDWYLFELQGDEEFNLGSRY